ncbi:hypothetical protein BDV25DRAFT_171939 [Aspergillus avenaceus]|uniref:SRR1-like domain-containing protein n=1 Tax=Aspergillus avenaceus TaxID=36643 RepID=A0A5N6TCU0_ASPAV|nr:hypothetical protein BDV25DRAFT_171939 [Aspergillus avenaceus]
MPHSNRRKKPPQKRLEVTDPNGWTHVTTSGRNARRALRTPHQDSASPETPHPQILAPAEAPPQLTIADLQAQFHLYQRKWEASESWAVVRGAVSKQTKPVDRIVCIGLGSPSGFLKGGWVDRRSVSMYQLAGLVGVMGVIGGAGQVYAQDPVFNELDRALLESLGIVVVDHPLGFEKVSSSTLLYCPGAERTHLEQLLSCRPVVVFGGPLEDIESTAVKGFVESSCSVRIPQFGEQEHAFWNMRVYFPEERDGGDV